jgi:DNA-binding GntR family transcriptional regulator
MTAASAGAAIRQAVAPDASGLLQTPVPPDATLADRAYLTLRDRIVTLQMAPGSLIREEELMEELDMSRTPIREALLRLSLQQLVVVVPRRGTFVSDVNAGQVGTVYELRRELEVVAAGWAAERRTDADLPEIEAMQAELRAAPRHPSQSGIDARSQIDLDQRAHHLIYRLSRNACVEDVLRSYFYLSARIWFLASGRVTMDEPFDHLVELLEAVKAGDAEEARRHAALHSEQAEQAIRAAL